MSKLTSASMERQMPGTIRKYWHHRELANRVGLTAALLASGVCLAEGLPSMVHPMKFNKHHRPDDPIHHFCVVIVGAVTLLVMGCATTAGPVRLEDRSTADKLGLQNCKVSVPLSPSEAVEIGRRWEIYPNPEKDPDWIEMLSMQQQGDELRLISCSEGNPYFYAMIRNGAVMHRHLLPVLD